MLDTFLYDDPDDNTATAQAFGIVQAGVTQYQLARSYGGWVEPVLAPKANPVIKAGGTTLTPGAHYTIGPTGIVTISSGASAGQALTWTGGFYWRCRFLHDSADFEQFLYQLWSAKKIEFQTVKA